MNFILKTQLLPITPLNGKNQFYQFQAKKIKEQQIQQQKKLDQFLKSIQEEQQKQKIKNNNKPNVNLNINNISKNKSINNISLNYNNKSFQDFYQKNKKWKQNVQAQILRKKNQKILREQSQILELRKPLIQKDSSLNSQSKQSFSYHAIENKGPITGWNERFKQYIKKRLPQQRQNNQFIPKINEKSKLIASRMVGKVEDRLIKFGQILKIRKEQMINQETQKIGKNPNSNNQKIFNTNNSQFFYRLYKEAESINRKIKQNQQISLYSFKPKINQISKDIKEKIDQKRQKNPLFSSKKFTKNQKARLLQFYNQQTKGNKHSQSQSNFDQHQFDKFIKRNEILIQKKAKHLKQKLKNQKERQKTDLLKCTFIPLLNPKSMKIFQKLEQERSRIKQQDAEYYYSSDDENNPMQQSSSPLFSNIQGSMRNQNIHQFNQNTYDYSQSFKKQSLFDYEMNSPQPQKISKHYLSKIQNQKTYQLSKNSLLHDPSFADSLQFSNKKSEQTSKLKIKKSTKQQPQNLQKGKQSDEIFNLDLSQSNKKMNNEIKLVNHEKSNQKNINYKNPKNWQDELDQVKNKLKKLMK